MSKKPSGTGLSRSRDTVTAKWKRHGYEKQKFEWHIKTENAKKEEVKKPSVGKNVSNKKIKLKETDYYPYSGKPKLSYIQFYVAGKSKGKKMSGWAKEKMNFVPPHKPNKPSISLFGTYTTILTVTIPDDSSRTIKGDTLWATQVQYQSCLLLDQSFNQGSDIPDSVWGDTEHYGSELKSWIIWDDVNQEYKKEFSTEIDEFNDTGNITAITSVKSSAVRWYRVRVSGPGGDSEWVYHHWAYSEPKSTNSNKATIVENPNGCYTVTVDWSMENSLSKPIDNATIEYTISTPRADLTPSSTSPQTAEIGEPNIITPPEVKDNTLFEIKGITFSIQDQLEKDYLIYVRVNTQHNGKTTHGTWILARMPNGDIFERTTRLNKPDECSIDPLTGNQITVTATNTCVVPGVFLTIGLTVPMTTYQNQFDGTNQEIISTSTKIIGIITNPGTTAVSKNVELPPEYVGTEALPYSITLQAVVGTYSGPSRQEGGYNVYTVSDQLTSEEVVLGDLATPPAKPELENLSDGNIRVKFDWTWSDAESIEIAWSDYELEMESNEEASSYILSDTKRGSVIIRGLETGITWHFWTRYLNETQATSWSPVASIALSSAPNIPFIDASRYFVTLKDNDTISLTWAYVSTDTTEQASAKIAQIIYPGDDIVQDFVGDGTKTSFELAGDVDTIKSVTVNGETATYTLSGRVVTFNTAPTESFAIVVTYTSDSNYYKTIARVPDDELKLKATDQYIVIDPVKLEWESGRNYDLVVKVTSKSGIESEDWSDPVTITVPEEIECTISSTSLVASDDDDLPEPRLRELPMTVKVDGASETMTTYLYIERYADHFTDRPDGGVYGGYAGETVVALSHMGDSEFTITQEDVYGYLDDTAYYRIIAKIEDSYGQTASNEYDEDPFIFRVDWEHQAVMPEFEMRINPEEMLAFIKILEPEGVATGDVCDIYRKSIDGYELIFAGASFGVTYVDPFPTIGRHGGHRVVYRTYNGDYMIGGEYAWVDVGPEEGDIFDSKFHYIDFGPSTLPLTMNTDLDGAFKKDFQATKYLGGSIEGDINSGIEMTGSATTYMNTSNIDTMEMFHRLAEYDEFVRIRTTNGANYVANVDVTENVPHDIYYDPDGLPTKLATYSLNITRVDSPSKSLIVLGTGTEDGYNMTDWYAATPLLLDYGHASGLVMPDGKIFTLVQPEGD